MGDFSNDQAGQNEGEAMNRCLLLSLSLSLGCAAGHSYVAKRCPLTTLVGGDIALASGLSVAAGGAYVVGHEAYAVGMAGVALGAIVLDAYTEATCVRR